MTNFNVSVYEHPFYGAKLLSNIIVSADTVWEAKNEAINIYARRKMSGLTTETFIVNEIN